MCSRSLLARLQPGPDSGVVENLARYGKSLDAINAVLPVVRADLAPVQLLYWNREP